MKNRRSVAQLGIPPLLLGCLLCGILNAADSTPDDEANWQKLETRPFVLQDTKQVLSPGMFDRELWHVFSIPKDNSGVDLGLPHAGKDAAGKDRPRLMVRLFQKDYIWIDLNGDGKPSADECRRINSDGYTDSFFLDLYYSDGTSSQYSFRFRTMIEEQKFSLLCATARIAEFEGQKIVLLDDNGNGKYNDLNGDAIIIGHCPVSFLGKYILINDKIYELLVHEAGSVIELRLAPKIEWGWIDMFDKYKPPQKNETLKIHTIIASGPLGSFAFDEKHKKLRVPAGAYDIVFGLFERAKEWAYLKKGEKTSFTVATGKVASPKWGGKVEAAFDVDSDGDEVTVQSPNFFGEGSEQYFPDNYRATVPSAGIAQVYTDTMRVQQVNPFNSRRFEMTPEGGLKSLIFNHFRNCDDDYLITVNYSSGIIGRIETSVKFRFIRKRPEKKS